mgnify:CR=1 FL=1
MPDKAAHRIEILFSAKAVAERVDTIAREIAAIGLDNPLVVSILTGSFVFAADLLRAIAEQPLRRRAEGLDMSRGIDDDHRIGHGVEN